MDIRRIRSLLSKIQNIVDEEISIIDDTGYIIDSTNFENVGEYDKTLDYSDINDRIISKDGRLYYLINSNKGKKIIISIKGDRAVNEKLLQLIGLFLNENMSNLTREEFIKGIMLKEFEQDEIKGLCEKFKIKHDLKAQAVIIKLSDDIIDDAQSIISNMYPEEVLISLNNNTLAFVKIFDKDQDNDEYVQGIYDTIFSELLYEPIIGVGTIAQDISYLHESYEKANLLIKLGNDLDQSSKIYDYNYLLMPIMVDNIDTIRLKDIIRSSNCSLEDIVKDNELLLTATKFFENNLNVSDTARKLYVHRNTLIYRLNKIQNITGLDLRCFQDAINFNILMTINKYLQKKLS